jgi:hypothetical protein
MELARAWFRNATPECPSELRALFESVEALRGIELIEATPEHVTRLPKRGEGRNHDLHVRCLLNGAPLTVCIEGKADETFGRTIADELAGKEAEDQDPNGPARPRRRPGPARHAGNG